MASKEKKLSLTSYDDLFQSSDSRDTEQREQIVELPLNQLHPFKNHPFRVRDDEAMARTVESVKEYGVLTPGIARPLPNGDYEIVAGHRRKHACELAGLATMPFIVRDMDDDTATILMCDSNLQRENILPSERAFAYKMKLEAIKRQGARTDLTSDQVGQKLTAREVVAKSAGESAVQVQRYIRLTELTPELIQLVDDKKIALNPAVEMVYLKPEEQSKRMSVMAAQEASPFSIAGATPQHPLRQGALLWRAAAGTYDLPAGRVCEPEDSEFRAVDLRYPEPQYLGAYPRANAEPAARRV